MKMPTVIDSTCLPWKLPIWNTVTFWLLLDRFKVPGWAWGVFWTLMGISWVTAIIMIIGQKRKALPGFGESV